MDRRFGYSGRPRLPSLLDPPHPARFRDMYPRRSMMFDPYSRFGGYDGMRDFDIPPRFPRQMDGYGFPPRFPPDIDDYDFPERAPRKEEILMDLGQTVLSSLKGGQKLTDNPIVREKIETLLEVEKAEACPDVRANTGGPYHRYDAYYETDFRPPGRFPPPFPEFSGPPFPEFSGPGVFGELSKIRQKFARLGDESDFHRIWASEREMFNFLQTKGRAMMDTNLRNRLKNTLSYEISRETVEKRKNWLTMHYNFLLKTPVGKKQGGNKQGPNTNATNDVGIVVKRRKESAAKKEKKRLADKRPPQTAAERLITNYLKSLLLDLCGDEKEQHCVLVLRAIAINPKIIKCLMTECKTMLDQKFGEGDDLPTTNAKQKYIIEHAKKHAEETQKHLSNMSLKTLALSMEERNRMIDDLEPVLTGRKYAPEMFSTPEDFIIEPNKTDAEFVVDFKYMFARIAFEKFNYKVVDNFCVTKDFNKRVNFFMNNGFIAGLIVDCAKGKPGILPAAAKKYIADMDRPCRESYEKIDAKLLACVKKTPGFLVETNVDDLIGKLTNPTPATVQLLKKSIAVFDPKASVTKFQLIDYTPYIRLTREYKVFVFEEIIKFIYLQCCGLIEDNVDPAVKKYTDMEKD